jgi:hypothetical protein
MHLDFCVNLLAVCVDFLAVCVELLDFCVDLYTQKVNAKHRKGQRKNPNALTLFTIRQFTIYIDTDYAEGHGF